MGVEESVEGSDMRECDCETEGDKMAEVVEVTDVGRCMGPELSRKS